MEYFELHRMLKEKVDYADFAKIDALTDLYNFDFESRSCRILPCEGNYRCEQHRFACDISGEFENTIANHSKSLNIADAHIVENRQFRYHVFHPSHQERARKIVLMFHGFNEKHWAKYLPWAKRLSENTGKTIILFPIAFHMNRAPQDWSDRRKMFAVSELRRAQFPRIAHSTLSNVAISMRLHTRPQRFFWSGLQSYYDVIRLTEEIKADKHPLIAPDASIDFFAYSIGCLLAEILMMTNQCGYFDRSKLFMFCGGPVFNRLSPVSKFILDSEANVALYSFVVEHLENHLKNDPHLQHYLSEQHPEGVYFRSMLNYGKMLGYREEAFGRIGSRVMAVALENDTVIPPYEVVNTLQGVARNLPATVEIIDFPYPYKHEDPFPCLTSVGKEVTRQFHRVFEMAGGFLGRE
ncbi:MAG: DUF6051 family protein [Bacteroidales bacterium]|jgi:hypothetical protein|nr:DUF6051 family protein [Bacteroidales bacterium]